MKAKRYLLPLLLLMLTCALAACGGSASGNAVPTPDQVALATAAPTAAVATITPRPTETPSATPSPTRTPSHDGDAYGDTDVNCDGHEHAAQPVIGRVHARAELSWQRHRYRAEAAARRELPARISHPTVRGPQAVRPADGAEWPKARDRLAGDRLQPRLHPACAIPDHRAVRGLRGRICPQRLHRLPARLSRPRQVGRAGERRIWLARLHHRRAERSRIGEALHQRRPEPDRHVGPLDGRAASPCAPW